ncbi:MAG: hypothetical protein LBQ15_11020 [Clostridium sp.]|jgi:hypothetical protein|nr:hypothetical protein [Clostridium sp.]
MRTSKRDRELGLPAYCRIGSRVYSEWRLTNGKDSLSGEYWTVRMYDRVTAESGTFYLRVPRWAADALMDCLRSGTRYDLTGCLQTAWTYGETIRTARQKAYGNCYIYEEMEGLR